MKNCERRWKRLSLSSPPPKYGYLIIYCLNCIRCMQNSTFETELILLLGSRLKRRRSFIITTNCFDVSSTVWRMDSIGPVSSAKSRPIILCSLLAATSKFSILICQKMLLTGWHIGNDMRNAIHTNLCIPNVHSVYCGLLQAAHC